MVLLGYLLLDRMTKDEEFDKIPGPKGIFLFDNEKSNDLVKKLEFEVNKIKTDLHPYVTDLSLNSVCETAMGISLDKEASDFSKTYKSAVHKLGSYLFYRINKKFGFIQIRYLAFLPIVMIEKYIQIKQMMTHSVDDTIGTKKKRLAMLDLLLVSEKEGKIDREGIHEEVDTFMLAGYDTTATALKYAFMLLANHKEEQDKILEESAQILNSPDSKPTMNDLSQMKYLKSCIKETLRLYPPVHFISRQSDQPVQFSNRIPFSAGPRNCIGQKFAMLEMKMAILAVLREYRLLPVTKPDDIVIYMYLILRSTEPIYVKFEKRNV
ncbi:cytochrome P450 4C1-like [Vanessa tameamea]|uniref:Cytochrome P450 4C1-like n=1 Tax=Vanessa tameamea TaxID=334116 RepID=A0ABM4AM98_VANTA